jgi:hypothetical protein
LVNLQARPEQQHLRQVMCSYLALPADSTVEPQLCCQSCQQINARLITLLLESLRHDNLCRISSPELRRVLPQDSMLAAVRRRQHLPEIRRVFVSIMDDLETTTLAQLIEACAPEFGRVGNKHR